MLKYKGKSTDGKALDYTIEENFSSLDASGLHMIFFYSADTINNITCNTDNTLVFANIDTSSIVASYIYASDYYEYKIGWESSSKLWSSGTMSFRFLIDCPIDGYTSDSSSLYMATKHLALNKDTSFMMAYNWPTTGDISGYRSPIYYGAFDYYSYAQGEFNPYDLHTYVCPTLVDGVYRPVLYIVLDYFLRTVEYYNADGTIGSTYVYYNPTDISVVLNKSYIKNPYYDGSSIDYIIIPTVTEIIF